MATGTIILPILGAITDPTNPPGIAFSTAGRPYLTFDTSTDEKCLWALRMPENYASDPILKVQYSCTLTSGNFAVETQIMAATPDADQVLTDGYATVSTHAGEAVPGTADVLGEISHTMGNLDSLAAGDYFSLILARDTGTTSDVAADVKVWAVSIEYTTT